MQLDFGPDFEPLCRRRRSKLESGQELDRSRRAWTRASLQNTQPPIPQPPARVFQMPKPPPSLNNFNYNMSARVPTGTFVFERDVRCPTHVTLGKNKNGGNARHAVTVENSWRTSRGLGKEELGNFEDSCTRQLGLWRPLHSLHDYILFPASLLMAGGGGREGQSLQEYGNS